MSESFSAERSPASLGGDSPPLRTRIQRMPKAELHVHLDGSLRPETMIELAAAAGKSLPAVEPQPLRALMRADDAKSLVDYLSRFDLTLSVMQTAEALERIAYELALDLADENVRYAEIRYSPILNTREGLSLTDAVDAPLRGLRQAREESGIMSSLIICAIRNLDPRTSRELAELAVAYKDRGVVAFDLAGAERGHPPKDHAEAFRTARRGNLGVTIHAGEAYGTDSIRQAIHECGAHRVGHGTRLYEDPELMRYVRDFRLPLEICLTSNVQTRVVRSYEDHPLRRFYDEDLVLSLNTDNRLISGTTVTAEYWRAHTHLGFTWEELVAVAMMSFESAFLPWEEKQRLVARARREMETMEGYPPT